MNGFSPAALGYFEVRAIDPGLAATCGVREVQEHLVFPCCASDGESFHRLRSLNGNGPAKVEQPRGHPLTLWWPLGRRRHVEAVLVCEGESDALAALEPLADSRFASLAVVAVPGTGFPPGRLVEQLADVGAREAFLAFDGDDAGRNFADKAARALREAGIRAVTVELNNDTDLADTLAGVEDRPAWIDQALADAEATSNDSTTSEDEPSHPPALSFLSPADLRAAVPPEPPWVWGGYLARGAVTLLAGTPKRGKSTLSLAVTGAVAAEVGQFLSREVTGGPVVYVSEEGAATLGHKLPDSDAVRVLTRDAAWPKPAWPELVDAAIAEAERVGAVLLAVDTLSAWAGLAAEREKDAGAAQAVMQPLLDAARTGLAVLLVHHARKGGGEGGEAVRGSSALTGAADIVVELDRPSGTAPPRERVLRAFSRYPQTPDALRFDYEPTTASWRVTEEVETAAPELPLEAVWAAIRDEPGRSKRRVREAVTGNAGAKDAALAWLVDEGYVEVRREGQASRHYPLRPFPANRVQPCPDRAQTRFDTVSPWSPSVGGDTRHGYGHGARHEDTGTVGEQGE